MCNVGIDEEQVVRAQMRNCSRHCSSLLVSVQPRRLIRALLKRRIALNIVVPFYAL
jgi:hypothetical protein